MAETGSSGLMSSVEINDESERHQLDGLDERDERIFRWATVGVYGDDHFRRTWRTTVTEYLPPNVHNQSTIAKRPLGLERERQRRRQLRTTAAGVLPRLGSM